MVSTTRPGRLLLNVRGTCRAARPVSAAARAVSIMTMVLRMAFLAFVLTAKGVGTRSDE